jgi:type I restriction enzyme M protein
MIETAKEKNGKVGVIVPHGVLFRSGAEGRIREALIKENLLEAVIGLPENLFFGTGIPAAILIFNKAKVRKEMLFIDASKGFEKGTRQNKLRDKDIEKIVSTFEQFESVEKYSFVASPEELKENDYNLNIPRYVDTFEPEAEGEIEELESELASVRRQMEEYLKKLEV